MSPVIVPKISRWSDSDKAEQISCDLIFTKSSSSKFDQLPVADRTQSLIQTVLNTVRWMHSWIPANRNAKGCRYFSCEYKRFSILDNPNQDDNAIGKLFDHQFCFVFSYLSQQKVKLSIGGEKFGWLQSSDSKLLINSLGVKNPGPRTVLRPS